jgi:hypothetical protein
MTLKELEKKKWFKAIVQIPFYLSIAVFIVLLFMGKWLLAIAIPAIWFGLFLMYWKLLPHRKDEEFAEAFNHFINIVDGPFDKFKEWLHCHKIPFTNYQLNISFFMKNRTTSWDIIRKHKKWANCDPEDFPEK